MGIPVTVSLSQSAKSESGRKHDQEGKTLQGIYATNFKNRTAAARNVVYGPPSPQFRGQADRPSVYQQLANSPDDLVVRNDIYRKGAGTVYNKVADPRDAYRTDGRLNAEGKPHLWRPESWYGDKVKNSSGLDPGHTSDLHDWPNANELGPQIYKVWGGPSATKELKNANYHSLDPINPTRLALSVDERMTEPYVPVGGNMTLDRDDVEKSGAGVLHLREHPGSSTDTTGKHQNDKRPHHDPITTTDQAKSRSQHDKFITKGHDHSRTHGLNMTSMVNDTKRKEVIDLLVTGNLEEIGSHVIRPNEASDSFDENQKLTHEQRYKQDPDHLSKKNIPDYSTAGHLAKVDDYNARYSSDNSPLNAVKFANEDFVPLVFHDIVNKKYLPFRSFLNNVSDTSDATWSEVAYLGRADKVMVYQGFTRSLTVDFTAAVFTVEELHPMWEKINYLVGLTKPARYTDTVGDMSGSQTAWQYNSPWTDQFVVPPFVKFNLGDMYKNQPVVITNVSVTIPPEAGWELTSDEKATGGPDEVAYSFLHGTFTRNDVLVGQYPTMATLSVSLRVLEKRLPKLGNRHFGDAPSEHTKPTPSNPEEANRGKGFNYNLIHPQTTEVRKWFTSQLPKVDPDTGFANDPNYPNVQDPFDGNNIAGVSPCEPYPPSHKNHPESGLPPNKPAAQIAQELADWRQCVTNYVAQLMELPEDHAPHQGTWEDGRLVEVDGKPVPLGILGEYDSRIQMSPEPPPPEPPLKPGPCPPNVGGPGERDDRGRLIGLAGSESSVNAKKSAKRRNKLMYKIDVADYVAYKLDQPAPTRNWDDWDPDIKTQSGIVMEWQTEANGGNPTTYAGIAIPADLATEFSSVAGCDQAGGIREIVGNRIPWIYVDTSQNFKIAIDDVAGNYITNSNYSDVDTIKSYIANFVAKKLPQAMSPKADGSWADISADWTETNPHSGFLDDLYYAPFEENKDVMVKAHKVWPGGSAYVQYIIEDADDALGLTGYNNIKKLIIGFYAIVDKEDKVVDSTGRQYMDQELNDQLYYHFIGMNNMIETSPGVWEHAPDTYGQGELLSSDNAAKAIDPAGTSQHSAEIEDLKYKINRNNSITANMADANTPVGDYYVIGDFGPSERSDIIEKMANPQYQSSIATLTQRGYSRLEVENILSYMDLSADTVHTPQDELELSIGVHEQAVTDNMDIKATYISQKQTDTEEFHRQLEQANEQLNQISSQDLATGSTNPFPHGYYFTHGTPDAMSFPVIYDHEYDQIEWVDDGEAAMWEETPEEEQTTIAPPKPPKCPYPVGPEGTLHGPRPDHWVVINVGQVGQPIYTASRQPEGHFLNVTTGQISGGDTAHDEWATAKIINLQPGEAYDETVLGVIVMWEQDVAKYIAHQLKPESTSELKGDSLQFENGHPSLIEIDGLKHIVPDNISSEFDRDCKITISQIPPTPTPTSTFDLHKPMQCPLFHPDPAERPKVELEWKQDVMEWIAKKMFIIVPNSLDLMAWDENGQPLSINGRLISDDIRKDFFIKCEDIPTPTPTPEDCGPKPPQYGPDMDSKMPGSDITYREFGTRAVAEAELTSAKHIWMRDVDDWIYCKLSGKKANPEGPSANLKWDIKYDQDGEGYGYPLLFYVDGFWEGQEPPVIPPEYSEYFRTVKPKTEDTLRKYLNSIEPFNPDRVYKGGEEVFFPASVDKNNEGWPNIKSEDLERRPDDVFSGGGYLPISHSIYIAQEGKHVAFKWPQGTAHYEVGIPPANFKNVPAGPSPFDPPVTEESSLTQGTSEQSGVEYDIYVGEGINPQQATNLKKWWKLSWAPWAQDY